MRLGKFLISVPALVFTGLICILGYMAWTEYQVDKTVIDEALKGNRIAIQILQKYEKPHKLNYELVYEALKGNEFAIEVLSTKLEKKPSSASK